MMHPRPRHSRPRLAPRGAFTLVEMLLVLACISVAAVLVLPEFKSLHSTRLRSAAETLMNDLEYAQARSLGQSDDPPVMVFDLPNQRYWLALKSDPAKPITHPVDKAPYLNQFGKGRVAPLKDVTFQSINLGGGTQLQFGPFGDLKNVTSATITLKCGSRTATLTIDPSTGDPSIGTIN